MSPDSAIYFEAKWDCQNGLNSPRWNAVKATAGNPFCVIMHQETFQILVRRFVAYYSQAKLVQLATAIGLLVLLGLFPLILTLILSITISPQDIDRLGNWSPLIVDLHRGTVVSLISLLVFCGGLRASFAKRLFTSLVAPVILGSTYRLAFLSLFPNTTYFDEAILRDCASIGSISFTLGVVARYSGWVLCNWELELHPCRHSTFSLRALLHAMVLIGLLASICRLQSAPKWDVVLPPSWQRIELATVSSAMGFLTFITTFLFLRSNCWTSRLAGSVFVLVVIGILPNLAIAIRETATGFELSNSNRHDMLYCFVALVVSQTLALAFARLLGTRIVKFSELQKSRPIPAKTDRPQLFYNQAFEPIESVPAGSRK